jgi:putative IMPACT (imprinted ancient) family translation regulator
VDASPSIKKIHEKERAPVAAQRAGGMSSATVDTGAPHGRADELMVATVASKEADKTHPVELRRPPDEIIRSSGAPWTR